MKERQELGCYRISINRQCDDHNSVYVKNTKLLPTDNCKDMLDRLLSIVSYHEKGGIWRRSLIIATIIVIFTYLVYNINNNLNTPNHYIVLILVIFCVIYFYHNYLNYHHFRNLKQNASEILNVLESKCLNKK